VLGFSRTEPSEVEWANLSWLPPGYCNTGQGAVFERLTVDLPLRCQLIESFEVDTPEDHANALKNARLFSRGPHDGLAD
jgi:hypothetical protein